MKYIIDLPYNCQWIQWIMLSDKDGHAYFHWKDREDLPLLDKELEEAYQRGLNDAWKATRKITGSLSPQALIEIFGNDPYSLPAHAIATHTATEAIAMIKAHEEKQKVNDFKVGDKVVDNSNAIKEDAGVITHIKKNSDSVYVMWKDGSSGIRDKNKITKTGEHTNSVEELLAEMKGEQRNCHTCKHQMTSSIECVDCCGYEKWEPKEVTE